MNISSLLNQIESGEIVLPAIQRDFVWRGGKIEKLMDSIMRGYPIGIVLMWETYNDIQYRKFEKIYRSNVRPEYFNNTDKRRLKIVLDGQQRLQSLYLAVYGKLDREYFYFDILSGRHSDDFEEDKYLFNFNTTEDTENRNKTTEEFANNDNVEDIDRDEMEYYIKVGDIFRMMVSEKQKLRKELSRKLNLTEDEELRLETNLAKLDEVLTKEQNIIKASTIDEDKPADSLGRQTESDVLEIFVRINRQGTPLSRSDLIFSMLKLKWKKSATALPEFVDEINNRNDFELDIDFVIRCLYAVSDLGTKFDIDLLRKKSNMDKMRDNFNVCCEAIRSLVDSVQQICWISSSKAIGGNQNFVPFVYYLFHTPKHLIPDTEIDSFRKSLFLFSFIGPFSRYADSRLGKFIKVELNPKLKNKDYSLPYYVAIKWVAYWEGIKTLSPYILGLNPRLTLHIIQQQTGAKSLSLLNTKEMDHIFPRSVLREKGYEEAKINNFANFWLLSKGKNINKSNKHPKLYFKDVSESELKKALINRNLLDYRRYSTFIEERKSAIFKKVCNKIGFKKEDWLVLDDD